MISQIERQVTVMVAGPANASAEEDTVAAHDFLDAVGSDGPAPQDPSPHDKTGPRAAGKPKLAGADEKVETGELAAGQLPTLPPVAPAIPDPTAVGAAPDAGDLPFAGIPAAIPATFETLAAPVPDALAPPLVAAAATPGVEMQGELQTLIAALAPALHAKTAPALPAFEPGASTDAAQSGPTAPINLAAVSAQQMTASNQKDMSLSAPGTAIAQHGAEAAFRLEIRPLAPPLLRSNYSQAATILMWKAGQTVVKDSLSIQPLEGLSPLAAQQELSALRMPEIPPSAAILNEGIDDPQHKAILPFSPPPSMPEAPKPDDAPALAPAATADAIPQPTAAAPALVSIADPAPSAGGSTALPAPFHPLVKGIRSHAETRDPSSTEPSGTELLLHPADLGRIRFALSGSGQHMVVTVAAENPDTLRLLQNHAADLRAELAREGLGQASLSFSGPGTGDPGGQSGRSPPFATPADSDLAERGPRASDLPPASMTPQSGGGLDLRL